MVIRFDKRENIIVKWIRLGSICISFICIVFAMLTDLQYPIWLLPFAHAVGIFLLGDRNATVSAPGIVTLNVVMFCRYEIVPLSIYIAQRISKYAMNTYYVNQAVLLMLLELVCIFLVLGVTGSKYRLKTDKMQAKPIDQLFIPQNKSFVFFVLLFALLAIVIRFPSLVSGIGLIISGGIKVTSRETGFSGVIDMIWRSGLAWIYVYILSKIKDRDSSGKRSWVLIIVVTLVYILFSFIMNLSISRWYSVVCFVAAVFLIAKIFPQIRKRVCICTILPAFIVLIIVSVYKNTSFLSSKDSSILNFVVNLLDVSTLDAYFAGPGCVNNGLNLFHSGKGGLSSMLFDTLRNMPVVNHYIDDSYSTVELYASMLGRGDMIVPLSIQSMIYFTSPFFGVLAIIAVALLRKMDERYLQANNGMAFIYGFVAVWFGLIFILNYTICVSWFYAYVIPAGMLFAVTTIRHRSETQNDA